MDGSTFLREAASKEAASSRQKKRTRTGKVAPGSLTSTAAPSRSGGHLPLSGYAPVSSSGMAVFTQAGGELLTVVTKPGQNLPVLTAGKAVCDPSSLATITTSSNVPVSKSTKSKSGPRPSATVTSETVVDRTGLGAGSPQGDGGLAGSLPIPPIPALSFVSVPSLSGTYAASRMPMGSLSETIADLSAPGARSASTHGFVAVGTCVTPSGGPTPSLGRSVLPELNGEGQGLGAVLSGTSGSLSYGHLRSVPSDRSGFVAPSGVNVVYSGDPARSGFSGYDGHVTPSGVSVFPSGDPFRSGLSAGDGHATLSGVSVGFSGTSVSAETLAYSGGARPSGFPVRWSGIPASSGLPASHVGALPPGFSASVPPGFSHRYPSAEALRAAFPAGNPFDDTSSSLAVPVVAQADLFNRIDQRIESHLHKALASFFGGRSDLQSIPTVTASPATQDTIVSSAPVSSQELPPITTEPVTDEEFVSDDELEVPPSVAPLSEPATEDFVLDLPEIPERESTSDPARILKGIRASAKAIPARFQNIAVAPVPGLDVEDATPSSGRVRILPDRKIYSWLDFHLNHLRGWKDRGAAEWSDSSSCTDFRPATEKYAKVSTLWKGEDPVSDPHFPSPVPCTRKEFDLCVPRPLQDRLRMSQPKEVRLLAAERAAQSALQGLTLVSTFASALSSVCLEPGQKDTLREEPDVDLTLALLQSLPGAISRTANALSAAFVNLRVARRDEVLDKSNFSPEALQQLRLAPFSDVSLFDLSQLEAARTEATADHQQPVTADNLVGAIRSAVVNLPKQKQGGANKQGGQKPGQKRKPSDQPRGPPPHKRAKGKFSFKRKGKKPLN